MLLLIVGCQNPSGDESVIGEGAPSLPNTPSGGSSVTGTAPSISAIANQSIPFNTSTSALAFTITDEEDSLDCTSSIFLTSSNTDLIDSSDIVFSGTAPNCSVILTPKSGQVGLAAILITVTDGAFSAASVFSLNVFSVTAPLISDISDQNAEANLTVSFAFTISDPEETLSCSSSVSMTSSNSALIADSDIAFSGAVPNCMATLTPNLNQIGTSTITLTVSDGSLSSQDTFELDVSYSPKLISGISLWLDAKDSSTLFQDDACSTPSGNSDSIGCWLDKSGNDNKSTATGTDRPLLSSDAVRFVGSAAADSVGNCMGLEPFSAQTIVLVVDNAQTSSDGIHGIFGNIDSSDYLFISTNKGYAASFDGTQSDTGRVAKNDSPFSGTGEDVGSNITSSLQLLILEFSLPHSGWNALGCMNVDRYRANLDLIEMLSFTGTLSASDLSDLKTYLNSKHIIY